MPDLWKPEMPSAMQVAMYDNNWVILFTGFVIGFMVIYAEPAVHVLNNQVQAVTSGRIQKKDYLICPIFRSCHGSLTGHGKDIDTRLEAVAPVGPRLCSGYNFIPFRSHCICRHCL
jgi:hypothetical protein